MAAVTANKKDLIPEPTDNQRRLMNELLLVPGLSKKELQSLMLREYKVKGQGFGPILGCVVTKGWVSADDDAYSVTEAGKAALEGEDISVSGETADEVEELEKVVAAMSAGEAPQAESTPVEAPQPEFVKLKVVESESVAEEPDVNPENAVFRGFGLDKLMLHPAERVAVELRHLAAQLKGDQSSEETGHLLYEAAEYCKKYGFQQRGRS